MNTLPRPARRTIIASLGVLALGAVFLMPSMATADDGYELVGEPQAYLIENVHASGKVLVIGSEDAQATQPDSSLAAAAVFTIATAPAAIEAQEVLFYPVDGLTDTYVLANAEGEILSRRVDGDGLYRYIEILTESIDDAAADPYSQWKIVDAGNGQVYIHNAQVDGAGYTAALDMYNWATADGSEIQTYDAGTANVQKWVLNSVDASVDTYSVRTDTGVAPSLPTSMVAKYDWGITFPMTLVNWDEPDAAVWNTDGTVTVTGTGVGYFDEEVPVTAEILVGTVGDAVDAEMTSYAGITVSQLRMYAPTTVERTISGSESTLTVSVSWDWTAITDEDLAAEGVVEVPATVATGFDARLLITLTPAVSENVLRGSGIHLTSYYGGAPSGLIDGNTGTNAWSDWRSGGSTNRVNPNSVSFYFDQPHQLTGAAVYDNGGTGNVGQVTVQYRDLIGGWIDMPATDLTWPYVNTSGALNFTFESAPVVATGMRVIVEHASTSSWMTLSEIQAYGPALAG
ncbi:hypothetical protein GCM10009808_26030 [Microbacterium sediminicola]|uniref:Bacterial Ig-like domain-containing protein n=1 Tax=Microbacterium sediminicola TaxID=415210 RepID=A0ABP4UJN1_9MICO